MTRRRSPPVGGSWDWLLRRWGLERRRVLMGERLFPDGWAHTDGWPTVSVAAMAREGGITGGSGNATQHFPEVYSEEVVFIWRAFNRLPEICRTWLSIHYVVPASPAEKAAEIGCSVGDYFASARQAADGIGKLLEADAK